MKRLYSNKLIVAIAGLALVVIAITAVAETFYDDNVEKYVLTVNNELLHFVAQPEAGYVLKTQDEIGSLDIVSRFLKNAGDVKISPIRGLGRKGTYVIYNERPAEENERTVKLLKVYKEVKYAAPLFSSNGETVAVMPEIVIRVKPGTDIEQVQTLCETVGCVIIKRMEFTEQEYLIEVLGLDAEAVFIAVEELGRAPEIEWACPNTASQLKLCGQSMSDRVTSDRQLEDDGSEQDANSVGVFPNDEYFPLQWHLHNTGQSGGTPGADIRAPEAWEITTGDPNIVVAILDCGVDSNHPDLTDNLVGGYDFYDNDYQPDPAVDYYSYGHGTACAGLIAAHGNNLTGVTGVMWNCKIIPIRVGGPSYWITEADRATAFRWTANKGADILSNSWTFGTDPTPILQSAIADITKIGGIGRGGKGCIVLFAAGNNSGPLRYPGRYPEVIAVGATSHNDVRCSYSNYGPELDIVAPSSVTRGLDDFALTGGKGWLWTTDLHGPAGFSSRAGNPYPDVLDYTLFSGTSGACPIAAGVAALILSVDPNLTNLEVKRILYRSAHDLGEPGWDEYYGWGRVDARAAVEMALNPPPPIYVDDDNPNDPGPGDSNISDPNENGSVEHPFDSIQKAINFALDTEEIVVLPGIYTGEGNRDIDFGGKILTVRSLSGPAACVIDCQGLGRSFNLHSGEGRDSLLEGFTIINGKSDSGGAISFMNKSSPTIRNCIFSNNIATAVGGAVNNAEGAAALINCTFHTNKDLLGGGAISNFSNGMVITNCILMGNEPGEIYSFGTIDVTYSNISGGFAGEGNIDADPLFADAENGDYHLKSQTGRWDPADGSWIIDDLTSPCIDAGDPNSPVGEEPEPNGGRINMGAYGGTAEASKSL